MSAASPSRSAAALSARGLTRRFGERAAVREVTLDVAPGERLAVIGPNGAGKTTLLAMLAGVVEPSDGEVVHAGGTRSGWVPQEPALYRRLSVRENLELFARLEKLPDPEVAIERMLQLTDLGPRAGDPAGRLSGGNQQRLNIAIGLLPQPDVLLLDEPSVSLDPRQRERLWAFILALSAQGTSIVYATHDVLEAERYADRLLVLADGAPLFLGTPADFDAELTGSQSEAFEHRFVAFLSARGH